MIKTSDLIKTAIGGAFGFAIGNLAYYYPDWETAWDKAFWQMFAIVAVVGATVGLGRRKPE
jgi:hypothetical protein